MIGVFDSGVGGLSVLREIRNEMPSADLVYVADRGRAPYGPRGLEEVQGFSLEISGWLLDQGAECLVVACNTASAAALDQIREAHPGVPVVGMEPAVKPAAESTKTGVIAVFATATTFQGRLFESVVSRFTEGVTVVARACPRWVELVELGQVAGAEVEAAVGSEIEAVLEAGADTLVLGCTHFSFLGHLIRRLAGPGVRLIDPAAAVGRQTARVTPARTGAGSMSFAASGDHAEFARVGRLLTGLAIEPLRAYP